MNNQDEPKKTLTFSLNLPPRSRQITPEFDKQHKAAWVDKQHKKELKDKIKTARSRKYKVNI